MKRIVFALRALSCVVGCVALQGCSTPAIEAYVEGRPEELNQLLITKQIGVNDYLPLESSTDPMTPLCAMLGSTNPLAISSIDYLINNGADVNLPCRKGRDSDGKTALDYAIMGANFSIEKPGPYAPARSGPSKFPIWANTINKLLKNGAKSYQGLNTPEAISEYITSVNENHTKFVDKWKADIKREEAESKKNSIFNVETLGAVAAIAGTATTIYANNNSTISTISGATINSALNRNAGSGSAAVRESNANTSLQNMAGMDTATANARAERSKKLDDIVVKLANDGGMKVLNVKYQCAPSDPVQTVSVPYKSQACAAAKEKWFTVYACNDVDNMSAATERCRQACGSPNCDEGL